MDPLLGQDCGVAGGALTWESGGLDLSLSSVEDSLGDLGSHLAFLWLSLLICQTRVPRGPAHPPGCPRHGCFLDLRFQRERLWAPTVVAAVVTLRGQEVLYLQDVKMGGGETLRGVGGHSEANSQCGKENQWSFQRAGLHWSQAGTALAACGAEMQGPGLGCPSQFRGE